MRSIDELASEICTLAGHINAANHRFLELIAEFDRRRGWQITASQSCAHWLNWKCGIALGAAREKVRVARALEKLPSISAAMASGWLSYSKAREITRVGNEANEEYLLGIARKTRIISAPLRRLLTARDKGCRFPGCCNERYIDMHHIRHWANGGETKPSNLVSLCRFHHRAVHEGGFDVRILDDGALRFVDAHGEAVDQVHPGCAQPSGDASQVPKGAFEDCWRGDRMDLGLAVDVLIQQSRKARDVPAGTSTSNDSAGCRACLPALPLSSVLEC